MGRRTSEISDTDKQLIADGLKEISGLIRDRPEILGLIMFGSAKGYKKVLVERNSKLNWEYSREGWVWFDDDGVVPKGHEYNWRLKANNRTPMNLWGYPVIGLRNYHKERLRIAQQSNKRWYAEKEKGNLKYFDGVEGLDWYRYDSAMGLWFWYPKPVEDIPANMWSWYGSMDPPIHKPLIPMFWDNDLSELDLISNSGLAMPLLANLESVAAEAGVLAAIVGKTYLWDLNLWEKIKP